MLLIPEKPQVVQRFTQYLQEQGFQIIIEESQAQTEEVANLKSLADRVRDSNLEAVAERLGLERDRNDPKKWHDANHIISITDGKFMDWAADKGGGGAIDLVMHVQKVDFKTAIAWLSQQTLPQIESPQIQPQSLQLPQAEESQWSIVRQYLVETRGLPEDWIDRLHQTGLIYADTQRNAVFLRHATTRDGKLWSRGDPMGANLRGTTETPFHRLASGTSREQGWFWIRHGKGQVQRIILVESAIDALSLATLERAKGQSPGVTIYLSTDGAGAIPTAILRSHLESGGQVIVAFDADKAGEKLAWRVAQDVLGVQRMTPAIGKDWNDRLLAEKFPERHHPAPDRGDKDTLKRLWKWYRVAAEIGQSEGYRQRIAEVAREWVEGQPLSEKAIAAMEKDFQHSQERAMMPSLVTQAEHPSQTAQSKKDAQAFG